MAQNTKIVTVFGGTGFLGRQVVKDLAKQGFVIKVATRVPERAYFLKTSGGVGQVVPFAYDPSDASSVQQAVVGSDYVVNCVGILFERGKTSRFQGAHVDLAERIAKACADERVERFVHVSSLSSDVGTSRYAKTKLLGEQKVTESFPDATILRPSVIFGEDDNFFNMFAELSRYVPFLPLIGGGKTRFQPIYVGDVAACILEAILTSSEKHTGKIYDLGGPDVITFKEVYEYLFKYTGRHRRLVSLPFWFASFEAMFLSLFPKPLLTPDQVESLKTDNVVREDALGIECFEVKLKTLDLILPNYLTRFRRGGIFSDMQSV